MFCAVLFAAEDMTEQAVAVGAAGVILLQAEWLLLVSLPCAKRRIGSGRGALG